MSLPTPGFTQMVEINANLRAALARGADISVLDSGDLTLVAVLVSPERYRAMNPDHKEWS